MLRPSASNKLVIPTFLPIIPDMLLINLLTSIEAVGLRSRHSFPQRDGKDRKDYLSIKHLGNYFLGLAWPAMGTGHAPASVAERVYLMALSITPCGIFGG